MVRRIDDTLPSGTTTRQVGHGLHAVSPRPTGRAGPVARGYEGKRAPLAARPATLSSIRLTGLSVTLAPVLLSGWLLAFAAEPARAQSTGQLVGVVRDTTGSVLPGVTVTVTGAALIAPRTVVTNEHGKYELDAFPQAATWSRRRSAGSSREPTAIDIEAGRGDARLRACRRLRSPRG